MKGIIYQTEIDQNEDSFHISYMEIETGNFYCLPLRQFQQIFYRVRLTGGVIIAYGNDDRLCQTKGVLVHTDLDLRDYFPPPTHKDPFLRLTEVWEMLRLLTLS